MGPGDPYRRVVSSGREMPPAPSCSPPPHRTRYRHPTGADAKSGAGGEGEGWVGAIPPPGEEPDVISGRDRGDVADGM